MTVDYMSSHLYHIVSPWSLAGVPKAFAKLLSEAKGDDIDVDTKGDATDDVGKAEPETLDMVRLETIWRRRIGILFAAATVGHSLGHAGMLHHDGDHQDDISDGGHEEIISEKI